MLFPSHLQHILTDAQIKKRILVLKTEFQAEHAKFYDISDADFLGLIVIVPSLGIARADEGISFREELVLNSKARKLSRGGFFMSKDPIVHYMNLLLEKGYEEYEDKFLTTLRFIIHRLFDVKHLESVSYHPFGTKLKNAIALEKEMLHLPYLLVKLLESMFFSNSYDELVKLNRYQKLEAEKLRQLGHKLHLEETVIFKYFMRSLVISR